MVIEYFCLIVLSEFISVFSTRILKQYYYILFSCDLCNPKSVLTIVLDKKDRNWACQFHMHIKYVYEYDL